MGVKGLTSFIDDNPALLINSKLCNSKVVIDGNNLMYYIFDRFNSGLYNNGDYLHFALSVEQVFKTFKQCNIEPCVVFDGGYDISDSKITTLKKRTERRISMCASDSRVLPIMTSRVFKMVLTKLNVKYAFTTFEADEEIAILANQWNCPVISNDSDFLVYNLKAGLLLLDYVDFRPKRNFKYYYLSVQKYHYDNWTEAIDFFKPDMMPLLATVLGNDVIDQETFEIFTRKFDRKKSTMSREVSKITGIMKFLNQFKTLDEGREAVLKSFENSIKDIGTLKNILRKSINSYTKVGTRNSYLANFFSGSFPLSEVQRNNFFGRPLPEWILRTLMKGNMAINIQNMAVLHRNVLLCQHEDMHQQSSHRISTYIRQIIYGILFDHTKINVEVGKKQSVSRQNEVEEMDRKKMKLHRFYISPEKHITGYGDLPDVYEINELSLHTRQELFRKSLGVGGNILSKFNSSHHFIIAVLDYWGFHSRVPKQQLQALILCILFLKIKTIIRNRKHSSNSSGNYPLPKFLFKLFEKLLCKVKPIFFYSDLKIDKTLQLLSTEELMEIDLAPNDQKLKGRLAEDALHYYSQYQSCVFHALMLNEILMSPMAEPNILELYDGYYLHHFNCCLEMRKRGRHLEKDVLCAIEKHPCLDVWYKSVTDIILTSVASRSDKKTGASKTFTLLIILSLMFIGILLIYVYVHQIISVSNE